MLREICVFSGSQSNKNLAENDQKICLGFDSQGIAKEPTFD